MTLELLDFEASGTAKAQIAALEREGGLHDIAAMFAAFSDPTRLKLLYALSCGELCVGDLASLAGVSPSAVSHHLQSLRALRLVRFRREGKTVLYALDDDHVQTLLLVGAEHAGEFGRRSVPAAPRQSVMTAARAGEETA